jgi:hypothetical protein
MAEEFLSNSESLASTGVNLPDREPVRIVLIGSRHGINQIVHRLHILGFAQVNEWSRLQPAPNTGKVMRVCTKFVSL